MSSKRMKTSGETSVTGGSRVTRNSSRSRAEPGGSSRTREPRIEEEIVEPNTNQPEDPPHQPAQPLEVPIFVNEAARLHFNDQLRTKGAIIERAVNQSRVNEEFWNDLIDRGWEALTRVKNVPPNLSIVREFCANAWAIAKTEEPHVVTVRGVEIDYSEEAIWEHLDLGEIDFDEEMEAVNERQAQMRHDVLENARLAVCPNVPWSAQGTNQRHHVATTHWAKPAKLVWTFVISRLHPTKQTVKCFAPQLLVVQAILAGTPIDASRLIHAKLSNFITKAHPKSLLVFPHLITDMAIEAGVETKPTDILAHRNFPPIVGDSKLSRTRPLPDQAQEQPLPQPQPQPMPFPQPLNFPQNSTDRDRIYQSSLGSQRDWANDLRFGMLSLGGSVSAHPYQYEPFVEQFVPGYQAYSFSGPEVGGVGMEDVTGGDVHMEEARELRSASTLLDFDPWTGTTRGENSGGCS